MTSFRKELNMILDFLTHIFLNTGIPVVLAFGCIIALALTIEEE